MNEVRYEDLVFCENETPKSDVAVTYDPVVPRQENRLIKKTTPVIPPMEKMTGAPGAYSHKDVLARLLSEITPVDFILMIRPDIIPLMGEYRRIEDTQHSGDKESFKKLNVPHGKEHLTRTAEIEEELKKIKKSIRQKHYVVSIITKLIEVAKANEWGLCKRYDYVYVYNGAYWKQLSKNDLRHFLGEVAIKMGHPEIEAKYHQFKEELLKQFITQAHLPVPEPNPKEILINLLNGTFALVNGEWELRPFNPENFLTYQLPFRFDAGANCPLFDNYLKRVLPDHSCRLLLQEFAGFIFTKLNLEKCLVLMGGGQNGKSVFFEILNALIGKENTLNFSLGLFNKEYNRARLVDVLLNYSSEKGFDLDTDTFKALISGEPVQARDPYGKSYTIHNSVKFIFNCNELPKKTESTEAYFRRFLIIPFDVKITEEEKDINLAEKIIENELAGIFNWLLIGLKRLVAQQKFTESAKVAGALADFKKQSDSVELFIDDRRYVQSKVHRKPIADLYIEYSTFCDQDGYVRLGKKNFSQKLESKGFNRARGLDGSKAFYIEVTQDATLF